MGDRRARSVALVGVAIARPVAWLGQLATGRSAPTRPAGIGASPAGSESGTESTDGDEVVVERVVSGEGEERVEEEPRRRQRRRVARNLATCEGSE